MHSHFLSAVVEHGDRHGRTIGYPTINLDPTLWPEALEPGVYASYVTLDEKSYLGALYFGPRSIKGETKSVLEINLLDFTGDVYGQTVRVEIGEFIRAPIGYKPNQHDETELQQQINKDISTIRELAKTRV